MKIEILENKIYSYITDIMLPKIPNVVDKFMAYLSMGLMKNNFHQILKPYLDKGIQLGIINNDEVKLESIENALQFAFQKVPSISLYGFTFNINDLPEMINYIRS